MGSLDNFAWRLRLPWRKWRVTIEVENVDELPNRIQGRSAVVVADAGTNKWLVFDCPCRTGHRVMLNIDSRRRPMWKLTSTTPLTVSPSVDVLRPERRCHYFVRQGRIEWVPSHREDDAHV